MSISCWLLIRFPAPGSSGISKIHWVTKKVSVSMGARIPEILRAVDFRPTPASRITRFYREWPLRSWCDSCPAAPNMTIDDGLSLRIRAEYLEMPGLRLTLRQAARMWNGDPTVCTEALNGLVGSGFLCKRDASYLRADAGLRNA